MLISQDVLNSHFVMIPLAKHIVDIHDTYFAAVCTQEGREKYWVRNGTRSIYRKYVSCSTAYTAKTIDLLNCTVRTRC